MMDNLKIVTAPELENLYHKSRIELGPNGIGRKVNFSMLSGDKGFISICARVVAYKKAESDPSFYLTLAFPLITETTTFFTKTEVPFYIIVEDVEVAALLGDDIGEKEVDEEYIPMVGHFSDITKLLALINHAGQFENSVTARRATFRVV